MRRLTPQEIAASPATRLMAGRIASSRKVPERAWRCLTRMLPSRGRFVNQLRYERVTAAQEVSSPAACIPTPFGGDDLPTYAVAVGHRVIGSFVCCGVSRRPQNPLSCSTGEPAFPPRPGASVALARNAGDGRSGATRSHAQAPWRRAWRGWRAPDLPLRCAPRHA
jgi:hypothetical protein